MDDLLASIIYAIVISCCAVAVGAALMKIYRIFAAGNSYRLGDKEAAERATKNQS